MTPYTEIVDKMGIQVCIYHVTADLTLTLLGSSAVKACDF